MSLPGPLPGLVVRYRYLWADVPDADAVRVYVLPITHSVPAKGADAMEIPSAVRRAAGLDAERAWVVLSEFNEFAWPGFDLDVVPNRSPRTVAYGFLTPGFFVKLRNR